VAIAATTNATAVAIFNLVINMVFRTPSVNARTLLEITPAAITEPANMVAASTVRATKAAGTLAEAAFRARG
jgi:hypothetical protein